MREHLELGRGHVRSHRRSTDAKRHARWEASWTLRQGERDIEAGGESHITGAKYKHRRPLKKGPARRTARHRARKEPKGPIYLEETSFPKEEDSNALYRSTIWTSYKEVTTCSSRHMTVITDLSYQLILISRQATYPWTFCMKIAVYTDTYVQLKLWHNCLINDVRSNESCDMIVLGTEHLTVPVPDLGHAAFVLGHRHVNLISHERFCLTTECS